MTLDLSLSEFTALVAKAFRGAGYPWGLANDGAYAARVLAQHRWPAAEIVARLLTEADRYGVNALAVDAALAVDTTLIDAPLCPVCLGAALADLGDSAVSHAASLMDSRPVLEPVLLTPWLTNCQIAWGEGEAAISDAGIEGTGTMPSGAAAITVTALDDTTTTPPVAARATRAPVEQATYELLLELAGRTYAPATEESRNAGAGE